MKFKELKKSLAEKVSPVYLLTGDDAFFLDYSVKLICGACLSEPDLNLSVFEGAEAKADIGAVFSALGSFPFMSDKRVVIIKEYYPLAADVKKLKQYAEEPNASSVLIIKNSGKSDQISSISGVVTVDCSKGDETLIASWIYGEGKKYGVVFMPEAVRKIAEFCRYDMTRINGEVGKLISYCAEEKVVTEEAVEEVCSKDTDYEVYKAVDFIADKRRDKAYEAIRETLGNTGDSQRLFVSLYYHFRTLLYVSVSKEDDAALAKSLGIRDFVVRKSRAQAKKFTPKRLMKIVDALSRYDEAFKQGRTDQTSAVWNGILTVLVS
ncbi:MAG TPA: DNA polymerase III subunit delta [Clostridiales bacterium]|nr:DNA polymerase III subunit delta [Clostridiales bacterium]